MIGAKVGVSKKIFKIAPTKSMKNGGDEDDDILPYQIRLSTVFWQKVDAWRRVQPDIPTRAEAIRRLVEAGLVAEQKKLKP